MNSSLPTVRCQDLSIGYGMRIIQQHLSLSLMPGEMVCLLGPNGCGKSTLLRTLAGLQPALSGDMHLSPPAIVLTERLSLDHTSVYQVVALGRYPYTSMLGTLTKEDKSIIQQVLAQMQLTDYADTPYNALSDGEKQRVLIAKALVQCTDIILLDEPTAHLDLPNRIRMMHLLRDLAHEQKKTILISTHELELALRTCDRVCLMSKQGVELDTAAALRERDAFTRAFNMDIFNNN